MINIIPGTTLNKIILIFTLEAVSRYRDPQLQVAENDLYLFNFMPNIGNSWCLNTYFVSNNSNCIGLYSLF